MQLHDFQLERYFAQFEFNTPHLLCSSDCESMSIADVLGLEPGAQESFLRLHLGYTESAGHPELRQAIAKTYPGGSPEDILVYSGAEEGIFTAMNVLLKPGDQVIFQSPCYQSLFEVANAIGVETIPWEMDPGQGWQLDLDYLKSKLGDKTRMLVVNFPANPTGFYPNPAFWHDLIDLCKARGIYLFSDEVYAGLEYPGTPVLSPAYTLYEKAISLGVMSKSLGLPGLRIGWTATQDKALFQRMAAFKDYTTICNAAPSEFLSILALKNRNVLLDRNRSLIQQNLQLLDAFFERNPGTLKWTRPKAGAIAFPQFTKPVNSHFYQKITEQAGVLLLPGNLYGYDLRYFRLGFGRKNMPAALAALEGHLTSSLLG